MAHFMGQTRKKNSVHVITTIFHDNQTTPDNISKSDLYGETFLLA